MATRPEEENPMEKARRRQDELKALGRSQLTSAAASARARQTQAVERGKQEAEDVSRAGGKAFAGARSRQAGGTGSLSTLGTITMDTAARRAAAVRAADKAAADRATEAEAKEQEITKFDIEAEKSPDEIEADLQKIDDKLKSIAESSPGVLGMGENETAMKQKIERWALDTRPTKAEWNRMRDNAKSNYDVGVGVNTPLSQPKFGPDGRFSGWLTKV